MTTTSCLLQANREGHEGAKSDGSLILRRFAIFVVWKRGLVSFPVK